MFRATVRLDERADVQREATALRAKAEQAKLDPQTIDLLSHGFEEILGPLVETGRKLKAQGSRIDVTRKLEGKAYSVVLKFSTDRRSGVFGWLSRFLRRS